MTNEKIESEVQILEYLMHVKRSELVLLNSKLVNAQREFGNTWPRPCIGEDGYTEDFKDLGKQPNRLELKVFLFRKEIWKTEDEMGELGKKLENLKATLPIL